MSDVSDQEQKLLDSQTPIAQPHDQPQDENNQQISQQAQPIIQSPTQLTANNMPQNSKKSKCKISCPCSSDCSDLMFAIAPATEENNCCLATGNIFCGCGLLCASVCSCGSNYQKIDLCCAGCGTFFLSFLAIGFVLAILQSVAIMCEDGIW